MKVKLITLTTPEIQEYANITNENKNKYCIKNNIEFKHYPDKLDARPPSMSKIMAIFKNLHSCDYVVWLDADAVITDINFDIKNELKKLPADKHFFFAKDWNGINAGVIVVRASIESKLYLIDIMKMLHDYIDHPWWEQGAIHELYKTNKGFADIVGDLKKSVWNCYTNEGGAKFILHLAGISHKERVRVFNEPETWSKI